MWLIQRSLQSGTQGPILQGGQKGRISELGLEFDSSWAVSGHMWSWHPLLTCGTHAAINTSHAEVPEVLDFPWRLTVALGTRWLSSPKEARARLSSQPQTETRETEEAEGWVEAITDQHKMKKLQPERVKAPHKRRVVPPPFFLQEDMNKVECKPGNEKNQMHMLVRFLKRRQGKLEDWCTH